MPITLITVGGVTVSVAGPLPASSPRPANPDPDNMEFVWPTRIMAMYCQVAMTSGLSWFVKLSKFNADGSISLILKAPTGFATMTLTVAAEDLDVPIWSTGQLVPPPPGIQPDPIDPQPIDPPPATTDVSTPQEV